MAYTTPTKVEQMFGLTLSGASLAAVNDIILAVKAFIDRYCGKTFESASEVRYYDGNGKHCILVDSFTGTPTVLVLNSDGSTDRTLTEGQGNDFITAPYNSTEKNEIVLTGYGWFTAFPNGKHRIKVTANFGVSASVPADIQFAATKLAGQMYQDANEGVITSIRLGDYSATFAAIDEKKDAMGITTILDSYRDIDI